MKKLQKLHEYLLGTNLIAAEQLRTFVNEGTVSFASPADGGADVSYRTRYYAEITVTDYGKDPARLMVALAWWLRLFEPDLCGLDQGFGFETEIKDKETVDLHVTIPLTETIRYDSASDTVHSCIRAYLPPGGVLPKTPLWFKDDWHETEKFLRMLNDG